MCPEVSVGTGWRPGTTLTMKCAHHLGPGGSALGVHSRGSSPGPARSRHKAVHCSVSVEGTWRKSEVHTGGVGEEN